MNSAVQDLIFTSAAVETFIIMRTAYLVRSVMEHRFLQNDILLQHTAILLIGKLMLVHFSTPDI